MSKDSVETNIAEVLPLRERQRREREESILTVALERMAKTGYNAMTMDELAAHAGISKPTLYSYFESKEDVAVRAVIRRMKEGRIFWNELPDTLSACERLKQAVHYLLDRKIVCRVGYLGSGRETLVPRLRSHPDYITEYEWLINRLTELVDQAKAEGKVRNSLITRVAVQAVVSFMRDAEYADIVERGEAEAEVVVETLETILLNGLLAEDAK